MDVLRPVCTCALCAALVLPAHADTCHDPCHAANVDRHPVRLHQPHTPEPDYLFTLHERPTLYALTSSSNTMTVLELPYDTLSGSPEAEERLPTTFSVEGVTFQLKPRRS